MKTLTRKEAEPLIKSGELRPAYLYEDGQKVYVEISKNFKRVYIYINISTQGE